MVPGDNSKRDCSGCCWRVKQVTEKILVLKVTCLNFCPLKFAGMSCVKPGSIVMQNNMYHNLINIEFNI